MYLNLPQFLKDQPVWKEKDEDIVNAILELVWTGREASTVNKYCLSLRKILNYIHIHKYSSILPFSSAFAAEYLTHVNLNFGSKSAVETSLAALKWVHSFIPGVNQWNNPMNDDFLSKIMSSSRRTLMTTKNQKKPLNGDIIRKMIQSSNLDNLVELRNCLVIALSFCMLLRHDDVSHMTLDHFSEMDDGYKILIPKSKTDKFRNGSHVFLRKSKEEFSISTLLEKYLNRIGLSIGDNHFLFFPMSANNGKKNEILSYASYRDIVKNLVIKINLDPNVYGTHSCRSGGASALAPHVTELELLTTGRWKDSRSIRSYVELTDSSRLSISDTLQKSISG